MKIKLDIISTDQVFSYEVPETKELLHFNITLLARIHKQCPKCFKHMTMDITQEVYDMTMKYRGIEEPRVERLAGKELREPGYGVVFDNEDFAMVDGHHRLVRRFRGGVKTMDFYYTIRPVWELCLVVTDPEELMRIQAIMPESPKETTHVTSRAVLRD